MQKTATYTQDDVSEIEGLLLGRRIVQAEMGQSDYPERGWHEEAEGRLVLDDGTVVYLAGNEGCGGCPSGCYELEKVATVDNIITNVRVEANPASDYDDRDDDEGAYRIFVVADAAEINVAEFVGTDGNGYYGTGFWLEAFRTEGSSNA